ncbi:Isoleucyl-tRNA synthetase [Thermoanaerobacter thermohydrosulfuricus]|uniref:Isoleucine--tRNA ligase n=1 Tax=Thermoanaerobacter thermohydrosulfuricus TaxID=1516 RepID=A0A1G7QP82_THETY|nr:MULTISPECIES: isoleucine--tRNA ligase [Thermoanaerobacter]UZQ82017.1 isoleucine--tRNA ligase [Thermoanaerobacter sp. RKWS2]SDG00341.1 Isoleucyl-tRNA synthetase [Thermoanaerobacter thermohydrosulfuricus]
MDYNKTLNLPRTDFPMKANLPTREPEILKRWEEMDIYHKTLEKNKGKEKYILHDGPPYANGDIHIGTAMNKVLKDIIVKYKTMRGYDAPYVPGWDTHGLPIEQQAIKTLGIKRHEVSPTEFRKVCRDFAFSQIEKQKAQFKRLGVRGDWDNPYLTLNPEYEAKQIEVFGEMAKKGYIYKGLKPVYWCPSCETALAEAEIEYFDETSDSIYVKFRVKDDLGKFKGIVENLNNVYFVIWTTTTWTIPANLAIALNPEFDYALAKFGDEVYIMAKDMLDTVKKEANLSDYEIVAVFKGKDLEGMKATHPLYDRDSLIILGEHVTLEAGTGCVHTAPGHGEEDFLVGQEYGLDVLNPIDDKGYFTDKAPGYAGLYYEEANKVIKEDLKKANALVAETRITHSYPHCWRCKSPIIFRATEQWFASVEGFREEALKAIKEVNWYPSWGEERITNMVRDRRDWCISRQRVWGVPIPIFYCEKCGKPLINDDTINAVKEIFRQKGSDAWFEMSAEEILPKGITCECGSTKFRKETDIMDVWFDSGSSHAAVLQTHPDLKWPAELYLEGSDQHRGWFQSSLLTSVATRGKAPYRNVLTHGFVVDGEGRKMSKSLGNGIDPADVIKEYGADILRLWTVSADFTSDMRISQEILKQMTEAYRKIRNTSKFLLSNLYDFDPDKDMLPYEELLEIDKWALYRLNRVVEELTEAFDKYEYYDFLHLVHTFCVVDMSSLYLDILKDRLYTYPATSKERRAAQTTLYIILDTLVRLIAPVLTFTSEEIWSYMKHDSQNNFESVQLADWPQVQEKYNNPYIIEKWEKLFDIRKYISKALEIARTDKKIGHSLEAQVDIYPSQELYDFFKGFNDLEYMFIVSKVVLHQPEEPVPQNAYESEDYNLKIVVTHAPGEKCERCWMYSETVGTIKEHPTICARCASHIEQQVEV